MPRSGGIGGQGFRQATNSETFRTLPSGLTHLQYAAVELPAKSIAVLIHNCDYMPND